MQSIDIVIIVAIYHFLSLQINKEHIVCMRK